jgi:hypothetical protein
LDVFVWGVLALQQQVLVSTPESNQEKVCQLSIVVSVKEGEGMSSAMRCRLVANISCGVASHGKMGETLTVLDGYRQGKKDKNVRGETSFL